MTRRHVRGSRGAVAGAFIATSARYFILCNKAEEEAARLRLPTAATVLLVVVLVVLTVAEPSATT